MPAHRRNKNTEERAAVLPHTQGQDSGSVLGAEFRVRKSEGPLRAFTSSGTVSGHKNGASFRPGLLNFFFRIHPLYDMLLNETNCAHARLARLAAHSFIAEVKQCEPPETRTTHRKIVLSSVGGACEDHTLARFMNGRM